MTGVVRRGLIRVDGEGCRQDLADRAWPVLWVTA